MGQLTTRYARRVVGALNTFPTARGWGESAAIAAATLVVVGAIGLSTKLYVPGPANLTGMPRRLVETLIAPAIGEEIVFRGLLIPSKSEGGDFARAWLVSSVLFVAWHIVEGTTFLRSEAALFLRLDFLACAAVLGFGCAVMRWRTGSLWPAVATHWIMVTIWQIWLGGLIL